MQKETEIRQITEGGGEGKGRKGKKSFRVKKLGAWGERTRKRKAIQPGFGQDTETLLAEKEAIARKKGKKEKRAKGLFLTEKMDLVPEKEPFRSREAGKRGSYLKSKKGSLRSRGGKKEITAC